MKLKLALLAAATTAVAASAAFAQENEGYYGALGAGVTLSNDNIDFEGSLPAGAAVGLGFDTAMDLDTNVNVYGAIGRYFENSFRGEIELATRQQDLNGLAGDGLGFAGFPTGTGGDLGDLGVTTLMFNIYRDFSIDAAGRLSPYLGAGVGAARFRPQFNNVGAGAPAASAADAAVNNIIVVSDTDYVEAVQGMAGLTFDFTDNMMLDLRYRYLRTGEAEFGGFVNGPLVEDLNSEYEAHEITAGFRWNFGAAPAPVVQEAPAAPQLKTCFDGSRVPVTEDCPPQIEEPADVVTDLEPLVVYFDYDKSNLTEAARTLIAARAEEALDANVEGVTVSGNTDTAGSASYNQALSARRAAVVRDALIANGISSNVITVQALGESNPARPTADGVREPLNRRTEVEFSF